MKEQLGRLDGDEALRQQVLPFCRLRPGEVWQDSLAGHRIGCLDARNPAHIALLMDGQLAHVAIQDPPYNVLLDKRRSHALGKTALDAFLADCRQWIATSLAALAPDAHFYAWLGADQTDGFQPLPDFMLLMRGFEEVRARSFVTMRNQRGYGTQHNWMAVRQELLYYVKGNPPFDVAAEYTDIPKILRGYYKEIGGEKLDNAARSKSGNIRAGNVWVDIQQVFYRMHENVPGCYAQKPLKAIERIVRASTATNGLVADFFAHSGTTLIACEQLGRRCFTSDFDPVFAEIAIRRLERLRATGEPGWQAESPFPEIA